MSRSEVRGHGGRNESEISLLHTSEGSVSSSSLESIRTGSVLYAQQSLLAPAVPTSSPPCLSQASQLSPPRRGKKISDRKPLLRRRNLITFSLCTFSLSALSVAILAIVLSSPWEVDWQKRTFAAGSFTVRVKCASLLLDTQNSASLKLLFQEIRGGDVYCSASTSKALSALFQLVLKRNKQRFVLKVLQDDVRPSPIAHKHLKKSDKTDPEHNKLALLDVESQQTPNQLVRHVKTRNSSLNVEVTGWYYVYSGLSLNLKCNSSFKHIQHYVKLISPGKPLAAGVLVSTSHTCCETCTDQKSTVFTGGIFKLMKGDGLYVSVSHNNVVVDDGRATFLGLMMLGSEIPPTSHRM